MSTIESLELEIKSNSKNAVNGIEALTQSLTKLKSATSVGLGLTAVANQLREISAASNSINSGTTSNVSGLASAIKSLGSSKISPNISKEITALSTSLQSANFDSGKTKLESIIPVLRSLSSLPKLNLTNYVNNLSKLDKALAKLNNIDIASVTARIQELATAFKPLGDEMQKVSNGFSSFPDKIQKLLNTTNNIPSANKKAAGSFTDFYYRIKSGFATLTRVGKKIYSFVEKSMDYTENMNLFTVAMGEYSGEAMEYAQTVSETMGIDTSDWIRAQGVFMTMATGFGVAGDRAATMSKNLTQLGYDLSSFYNIDVDDAMTKLKSGLAGELEPLRAIGYDLSQAKLEATAMELGITKSVSAMTQAEKAQLRYYAIMTQVTTAQGDMARTLDDPANQVRVFKAQLSMAGREIGNVFIPALKAILPYATAVAKVIGMLASSIAGLFGYKDSGISDSTSQVVENTDAVSENLQDAQEEAKKLKSNMLGFDELNVINPNTDSTADDTSSMFDFELPEYDFFKDAVESKVNDIVGKMKEWLGITEEIESWSDLLHTNMGNILVVVGLIAVGIAGWKIGTLLTDIPKLITLLGGLKGAITGIGIAAVVATAVAGAMWLTKNTEDTITKIGAIVSAAALSVGAILAFTGANIPLGIGLMAVGAVSMGAAIAMNTDKLSNEVKGVIAIITTAVSGALLAVGTILAFTGANIPLGIALMAGGALTMGMAVIPNWNTLSDSVKRVVSIIMVTVGSALLAIGAILAFSGVAIAQGIGFMLVGAASIGGAVALNWNAIVDAIRGPVGAVMAILGAAALVIGGILVFTGVGIPLGIGLMLTGAASLATSIALNWNTIVDAIKKVVNTIAKILSGAMLVLGVLMLLTGAGIGLGLALIFGSLKLSTKAWGTDDNPIINFVKKMVNGIVGVINKAIDGINDIFDFSFPGITIGGVTIVPGFDFDMKDIPKIPMMAEGGFPEQGQMFIAREAGAEMVGNIGRRTAVANNDQIVTSIAGGVAEANEEQNTLLREQNSLLRALLEKDSGVYLDGKNLTNSVEKYQRERGRVLITGGVV